MGRHPKPTFLKQIAGNPGKRPLNKREPIPDAISSTQKPPSFLALTSAAKRIWKSTLKTLPNGLLTQADLSLFGRWCELQVDRVELRRTIQESGRTIELYDPKGSLRTIKTRPEVAQLSAVETELRGIESAIGFTPAHRSKVTCVPVEEPNDLEKQLFG